MTVIKRISAFALAGIMIVSLSSCSGKKKSEKKDAKDDAAINKKYEQIVNEINSDGQNPYENLSFNEQAFSSFDYSLYPPSDETAVFSLEKNSFVKVNLGGTYFNSIAPGNETQMETEQYRTAKGLGILSTAREFIDAYSIEDGKALYKYPGQLEYKALNDGAFEGTLTAVYASEDDGNFKLLEEDELKRFLKIRDENSDGMFFDPNLVNEEFSEYKSLAVLDISVNGIGQIWEFSICRFEAVAAGELSH